MRKSTVSNHDATTFFTQSNEKTKDIDNLFQILTFDHVCQALNTLEALQKPLKRKYRSMIEYNRDYRVRSNRKSFSSSSTITRHNRSHRLSYRTCSKSIDKQQNEIDDSNTEFDNNSQNNPVIIDDIPHEIEFSLLNEYEKVHIDNCEYDTSGMLTWRINSSDNCQSIFQNLLIDTVSLTSNEKRILIEEAIKKLETVVRNHSNSNSNTTDTRLNEIEFTYQALQTTLNILSSILNSF